MAGQTVILELPEAVYRWAERTARTTERAVESVLVDALNTTLPPPLDQVPAEWREELEALETLSTSALLQVARERLTAAQVRQYDRLLEKNCQRTLTSRERARLTQRRHAADRIMLRRARADVLLKWRGCDRTPALGESGTTPAKRVNRLQSSSLDDSGPDLAR